MMGGRIGLHSATQDRVTRSRSERGNAVMISFLRQLDVPEAILAR